MNRALIVEDDPRVASLHRAFLEAEGFAVVAVVQGAWEALEFLEALQEPLDLVILDLYLPDGHGLDLLPALEGIYTVIITAAKDVPTVERALLGGAMDYLIKPFTRSRFQEALARYRAFRSLTQKEEVSQEDLDRLLARRRTGKGVDPITLERIVSVLASAEGALTAEEVARSLGLSRVSAWRYLQRLVQEGRVEALPVYGQPGRPARAYLWKRSKQNGSSD